MPLPCRRFVSGWFLLRPRHRRYVEHKQRIETLKAVIPAKNEYASTDNCHRVAWSDIREDISYAGKPAEASRIKNHSPDLGGGGMP